MNKRGVLSSINADFIRRGAASVSEEDIQEVMHRAGDIRQKVTNNAPLKKFFKGISLLIAMVKDCWSGAYRQIPVWVIGAVVFALLYVLSPIDLIPDFIPILGLVDDAAVLGLCLALTEKDIQKYRQWKESKRQLARA